MPTEAMKRPQGFCHVINGSRNPEWLYFKSEADALLS